MLAKRLQLKRLQEERKAKRKLALSILCISLDGMAGSAYAVNSSAESNVFVTDIFSTPADVVDEKVSPPTQSAVAAGNKLPPVAAPVSPSPVLVESKLPTPVFPVAVEQPRVAISPVVTIVEPAKAPIAATVPDSVAALPQPPAELVSAPSVKYSESTTPDTPAINNDMAQRIDSLGASLSEPSQHDNMVQTASVGGVIFNSLDKNVAVSPAQIDSGKKLVTTILKKKLLKTEFETDQQFHSRISDDNNKLSYFLTDNVAEGLKYDPEKKKFIVHQWLITNRGVGPLGAYFKMPLVEVPQRVNGCIGYLGDVQSGKYGGSITPELHVFVKDAAPNRSLRGEDEPYIVGEYAVDAKAAKLEKDNLKLLLIGKTDIASLNLGYKRTSQNMEAIPFISNVQYQIPFQLSGIYLYNAKTKRIVAPLSIQDEHFSPLQK